ncbi:hypothetical protein E0Z10_g5729 [Xylaria hypoxylon]|uniref:Uncharacterized protein n=1 Tax=Xylaria hypoxylon TaxID=37992 RepID=A0A4Z0YUG3_9PEZI|nr:hypothetical protein E0Z10_g5729 [Xylaria hypoxylon]
MDSRKKAKNGAARSHQQRAPSIAITSAPYTSSYMIVQEQSPPLSSPPPFLSNSSSSKRANELLNDEITSRSGPSRPSTKHGRAIQSTAPERSVAQSQETAGDIISNFPGTIPPPVEPRVRPKASCSEKANSTLQTTKLVKVLANNKALLFDCMSDHKDENDEDCKKNMATNKVVDEAVLSQTTGEYEVTSVGIILIIDVGYYEDEDQDKPLTS